MRQYTITDMKNYKCVMMCGGMAVCMIVWSKISYIMSLDYEVDLTLIRTLFLDESGKFCVALHRRFFLILQCNAIHGNHLLYTSVKFFISHQPSNDET